MRQRTHSVARRWPFRARAIPVAFTLVVFGAGCEGPTEPEPTQAGQPLLDSHVGGTFVEVNPAEDFGTYRGIAYQRVTGRFEGETAQGPFRVPFEIVVPRDAEAGNGTVLVEPPHFAQRFSGRDDYLGRDLLFGEGYRWVSVGWSAFAQSILDPTATDAFITGGQDDGIVVEFIKALRDDQAGQSLLGRAERWYGYGFSQTSWLMHRLLRSPGGGDLFDFTMLNATWWQGGGFQGTYVPAADVGKVIIVQAEADLVIADGRVLRAAAALESDYRVYEVAGAAHIPDIPENYDNPLFGPFIEGTNPVDWSIVARAAFVQGDDWVRSGAAPTQSVFLEDDGSGGPDPVYGIATGIARDGDLNALGGVRLPDLAVGLGRYMAADPNPPVAFLTGEYEDISCSPKPDGSVRFPSHGSYLNGVADALDTLRETGLVLPREAAEITEDAARSPVGKPGVCAAGS